MLFFENVSNAPLQVNSTITFSIIIAFVALVSPIATSLINNYHSKKMRQQELEYELKEKNKERDYRFQIDNHKNNTKFRQNLFNEYMKSVGRLVSLESAKREDLQQYGEQYLIVLMYCRNTEVEKILNDVHSDIIVYDFFKAADKLQNAMPQIRDMINSIGSK